MLGVEYVSEPTCETGTLSGVAFKYLGDGDVSLHSLRIKFIFRCCLKLFRFKYSHIHSIIEFVKLEMIFF